jgi:uncharacterized protein (DUF2336 family)
MQPLKSVVSEVEDAIASGEDARRVDTLRRITSLFIEQSPQLNDEHVAVFDEVIVRLAHEIEFRARVDLAERLADVSNAPLKTVRDLAFDENVAVAGPVLERSTRIDEADLVSIAEQRGQQHLLAISGRRDLPTAVTDVIVTRGDEHVVRKVANNETAKFSETGFTRLVERAAEDAELQDILHGRGDVPAHHASALIAAAKERARAEIMGSMAGRADLVNAALDAGADAVMAGTGPVVLLADLMAAEPEVTALELRGGLTEEAIVRYVKTDKLAAALVGLAHAAKMPAEMVANAFGAPHFDPLLFIVRGVRFSWPTFKALLLVKAGRDAPQALLKSAFASYESLSVPTAQRVMRFVAARQRVAPD